MGWEGSEGEGAESGVEAGESGQGKRSNAKREGAEPARWAECRQGGPSVPDCPLLTSRPCPAPSDLALRNCLLTSDLTVRIGDYGLAHSNYKVGAALHQGGGRGRTPTRLTALGPAPQEDYYLTPERLWIPLRWAAPELLGELHGTFMVVDQSRESNIW